MRKGEAAELATLKEREWREIAELDDALAAGRITEADWHTGIAGLVVPAYLSAATVEGGSGHSGDATTWRIARDLLMEAFDRPGTFLDIGCANGLLMESIATWSRGMVQPYGVDIAPELSRVAQTRLPHWADRIWTGNVLEWVPPRSFTYVRTGLEYAPADRRRELVERLLGWAERVLIGVYNEDADDHEIERRVEKWGFRIAGRAERPHRDPRIRYRAIWIDAA